MKMSGVGSLVLTTIALVAAMLLATTHCLKTSNNNASSNAAGNFIIAASPGWCDGHMIDGECTLSADAAGSYGGGGEDRFDEEEEELEMDGLDMMVEAESIRRGLAAGQQRRKTYEAGNKNPVFGNGNEKYTRPGCGQYNKECKKQK